jgi:tetratricopeptide (TPR) repeat protein
MSEHSDTRPLTPAPAKLELNIGSKVQAVSYEQAFSLAFTLIDEKRYEHAARLFERLQQFADRGPEAFIMQAFCEAAALHFDTCSKPLAATFDGENRSLAAELHNAFISYHVGIRQDAITALAELVNRNRDLPTLCLLLGDMLRAMGKTDQARKCWSLAIKRDLPNGSVAIVAARHIQSLAKKLRAAS